MGDIPLITSSDTRIIDQKPPAPGDATTAAPVCDDEQPAAPQNAIPQAQQYPIAPQNAFADQLDMAQPPPSNRQGAYNMAPMANSLPQVPYRQGQYPHANQQRFAMPNSPSMMQQMPQYVGHQAVPIPGQAYYVQQPQMGQYYGGHYSHSQSAPTGPPRGGMAYYPSPMMMNQQSSPYCYPPPPQYPPSTHTMSNNMMPPAHFVSGTPAPNDPRVSQAPTGNADAQPGLSLHGQGRPQKQPLTKSKLSPSPEGTERRQSAVRGPPRKPRQSGHAIWIGNLPPQTDLMTLVQHVCKEAVGLESLFLISKSNCAFANFKDEETCSVAQQKLHDSKFQTVRLVSRLRKSTVEVVGLTPPTGPAKTNSAPKSESPQANLVVDGSSAHAPSDDATAKKGSKDGETASNRDKFFILKSLTVEDLELSVKTGIWATQSHNEDALNNAFKTSDNVYLVFSANKSGEYFGYARMVSEINEDPAAAIEFAPKTPAASDLDLPKAIPTEATEHAPKGRIIDDSARGTIFWEAQTDEADVLSDTESVTSDKSANAEDGTSKTWGKPFKLEWLSTSRLPFYRTRGLRNPWNSNREVKIARDGTELEPSSGRRLVGLFNRIQPSVPVTGTAPMSVAPIPGFPQMRPYVQ